MPIEKTLRARDEMDVLPADRPVRYVNIAGRRIRVPVSRLARILLGSFLVLCGVFGFLPVLGFWMVPVGMVILSVDLPPVRRVRRRAEVWAGRRYYEWRARRRARRGSD